MDDTVAEFTPKQLEYVVTEEQRDLTQYRDLVTAKIADEIIEVMKSHNMRK